MLAIGARPRLWTVVLLLLLPLLLLACSPIAHAQAAQTTQRSDDTLPSNEPNAAEVESRQSVEQQQSQSHSVIAGRPTPQTQLQSDNHRTCAVPSLDYITRTLSEQCIETRWAVPNPEKDIPEAAWAGTPWIREMTAEDVTAVREGRERPDTAKATPFRAPLAEPESEADSPLDNADFLSFEEWKKKNLARAGQSPENVGHGRAASADQKPRRRPVNINALDALGEENEIDIDFSGFGNADSETGNTALAPSGEPSRPADGEDKVAPTSFSLSKDAGKTCKERFNYASYDCAAAILKTNDRAKSSSAVLVENKDSYMLNECSATNKFIIVELCDDILVDTVVLANYEFFSSMFRHFRVSVSDRYPVKLDRWRTLGEFEARNTREIQPFLITAPQIWARYLRIEFLTHYGNEFYCPLSLLRVHGTTMMEQFRREEEQARGDDDFAEPIEEAAEAEPVKTAVDVVEIPVVHDSVEQEKQAAEAPKQQPQAENKTEAAETVQVSTTPVPSSEQDGTQTADEPTSCSSIGATDVSREYSADNATATSSTQSPTAVPAEETIGSEQNKSSSTTVTAVAQTASPSKSSKATESSKSAASSKSNPVAVPPVPSSSPSSKHTTDATSSETTQSQSSQQPSQHQQQPQQPPPHRPSPQTPTQESFYKSIHKRLQSLESNSTLSLQYVEDQARMLRSALSAIEKRQLSKTEKFFANIEASVQQELEDRRQREEKRWAEMLERMERLEKRVLEQEAVTGVRLTAVADGLVWQKRMAVVQSTLVLVLLVGVLLVAAGRGEGAGQYVGMGMPLSFARGRNDSVYGVGGRNFESPDHSPRSPETENQPSVGLRRRRSAFRRIWRSDASERSLVSDAAGVNVSDAETDGRRSPTAGEVGRVRYANPESPASPHHRIASSPPEQNIEGSTTVTNDGDSGKQASPSIRHNGLPSLSPSPSSFASPSPSPSEQERKQREAQAKAQAEAEAEQACRLEALATQSGPATPRGSRDAQPSWEEVDRAVDLIKAGERLGEHSEASASGLSPGQGQLKTSLSSFKARRKGKGKKENRSPLRRAESYDDGGSPGTDGGMGEMGL